MIGAVWFALFLAFTVAVLVWNGTPAGNARITAAALAAFDWVADRLARLRRHRCPLCQREFLTRAGVGEHIDSTHWRRGWFAAW